MIGTPISQATDTLERQLAPPGFEYSERELLGRSGVEIEACVIFEKVTLFEMSRHTNKIADCRLWGISSQYVLGSNEPQMEAKRHPMEP